MFRKDFLQYFVSRASITTTTTTTTTTDTNATTTDTNDIGVDDISFDSFQAYLYFDIRRYCKTLLQVNEKGVAHKWRPSVSGLCPIETQKRYGN